MRSGLPLLEETNILSKGLQAEGKVDKVKNKVRYKRRENRKERRQEKHVFLKVRGGRSIQKVEAIHAERVCQHVEEDSVKETKNVLFKIGVRKSPFLPPRVRRAVNINFLLEDIETVRRGALYSEKKTKETSPDTDMREKIEGNVCVEAVRISCIL